MTSFASILPRIRPITVVLIVACLGLVGGASAQQSTDQEAADSLQSAYQKEYAFLAAQKRELEKRLEQFKQQAAREERQLERTIDRLEDRAVELEAEVERTNEQVRESERAIQTNQDNQQILAGTLEQASATLEERGNIDLTAGDYDELGNAAKVERMFTKGNELIARLSDIRRERGEFFLTDGTKTEGLLVRIGNIATYGVSDQGAGALAPAGGGALKLWQEDTAAAAKKIAAGKPLDPLPIFIYESTAKEVSEDSKGDVLAYIQSGGSIAWIIVGLGILAGLLALLRVIFLNMAGTSIKGLVDKVGRHVAEGELEQAEQACQSRSGSASRVVAATVRNLTREREHLEDIISEAILNEQGRLNRFGTLILVIAAVTPLLGLLGTVTGMISTFEIITEFGTGDPKLLSGGISTALVTTQLGLIVAIPALLVGNLLSGWGERIKDDMEKAALRITNLYDEARARA